MARVGFILGDMFEESEFHAPHEAVKKAGHEAIVIGVKRGQEVTGKNGEDKVTVDTSITDIDVKSLDALVIPGGYSPDHLRSNAAMVSLVRVMDEADKPVAAICHGPSILVDADILKGRTLTSYVSIKADLINAGAKWVDEETVVDANLLTSRKPDDLPAFCERLVAMIAEHVAKQPKRTRKLTTSERLVN
jgi:protease I